MDNKIDKIMNEMNELINELNKMYVSTDKLKEFSKFTLAYSVEVEKVIRNKETNKF